MSNAIKWALLAAGLVALIALVVALPFNDFINVDEFSFGIDAILVGVAGGFKTARGLINMFFSRVCRKIITGLLVWWFAKWAIKVGIKIVAWVYHFVFK